LLIWGDMPDITTLKERIRQTTRSSFGLKTQCCIVIPSRNEPMSSFSSSILPTWVRLKVTVLVLIYRDAIGMSEVAKLFVVGCHCNRATLGSHRAVEAHKVQINLRNAGQATSSLRYHRSHSPLSWISGSLERRVECWTTRSLHPLARSVSTHFHPTNLIDEPYIAIHLNELRLVLQRHPIVVQVDGHPLINFQRYLKFMDRVNEVLVHYKPPLLEQFRLLGPLAYLENQLRKLQMSPTSDDVLMARSRALEDREISVYNNRTRELRALGFRRR